MARKGRKEMTPEEEALSYFFWNPQKRFSHNGVEAAIARLWRDVKAGYKDHPCKEGCSECCHQEVAITEREARIILSILSKNLPQELAERIIANAEKSEAESCPLLIKDMKGCAVHGRGKQPLSCQLAGAASWHSYGDPDVGKGRTTVGCEKVNSYWQRKEADFIAQSDDPDLVLAPFGIGIYAAIDAELRKHAAGTIRNVIAASRSEILAARRGRRTTSSRSSSRRERKPPRKRRKR